MKKLILFVLCFSFISFSMNGQSEQSTLSKVGKLFKNVSISTSLGTNTLNPTTLQSTSLSSVLGVSMGDLQINYKLNSRFSLGLATMGNLGTCNEGYTNEEGIFTSFKTYDFERHHRKERGHHDNDDKSRGLSNQMNSTAGVLRCGMPTENESDDDDESEGCEDCFGRNIMGSFQFQLSDKLPLFVRVNAGYSFRDRAPSYSAFVGYHQKLYGGLGLVGGIQMSDVLRLNTPEEAANIISPVGLKAQMGLSWNF